MIHRLSVTAIALAAGLSVLSSAQAADDPIQSNVMNFADGSVIPEAEANLRRMDHGVAAEMNTVGLRPGHAVTLWWVVFNEPRNCSNNACGDDDVFLMNPDGSFVEMPDGSEPINAAGLEAAQISLMYADGHVIDVHGRAQYQARLPVGDTSSAIFGPGLIDPANAEVHLILRDHGRPRPGQLDDMIYTMNGGCSERWPNLPCENVQVSVFPGRQLAPASIAR